MKLPTGDRSKGALGGAIAVGVTEISVGLDSAAAAAGDVLQRVLGGLPWLGDAVATVTPLAMRTAEVAV
ncbi:hypothetical protein [Halobaculum gomorrense]|uniref:Uncharacterized protein n=1 Tax=Halobaculum gomorrense TaxID=43928 RepID=A0A1M5MLL4_9EURY|nr:hypothetical protein [Halobaculum gomorrense]SHG78314.1 hypothetical protein SAMN05443636_1061 [Halobaculum gomorrense]